MKANGIEEMSCVECAQELVDKVKEAGMSEEILNNAMQLLKKIQNDSKELKNVPDKEEEDYEEESEGEDMEEEKDPEDMTEDEMRKDLGKKGIIQIRIGSTK